MAALCQVLGLVEGGLGWWEQFGNGRFLLQHDCSSAIVYSRTRLIAAYCYLQSGFSL